MEFLSASESLLLEDFGQKVDLTRRIREVLLNYPEGTTVLKELIQNADDAGATRVSLCLDRRSHRTDSLLSPTLAQWQGPSLLAFNDAVFTDEDFVSISRIGGSTKHGQAWKTGRFGVGFNSVYHLTDLPSFVSGKYAVIFDPQGMYLPNVSAANPGKRIEYVNSSAISLYKDQFLPYCAFGCDMKSPFNGTLFRFPLRNADQAANSRLSRQAYCEDDIQTMFDHLYDEGVSSLLFLKSVLVIEMYVWDSENPMPRKLYSCSIDSADDSTISHRQLLLRLSKSDRLYSGQTDCFRLDFVSEDFKGESVQKRIDSFYIVQSMASGSSRIASFAKTASKEYDIHLLPWASVAACISDSFAGDGLNLGRAFCFLPLPVRTGLSVQVNGYFEVSSNRRGIWYGEDMDRSGKVRSSWNRLLLEDVIAPCFTQLLLGVQEVLGPTSLYYSLCPSGDFEEPWSLLVECIYRIIVQAPVLYTDAGGGEWVPPVGAFLHDKEFIKSDELGDVLVQLGMPIARVPQPLHDMLLKHVTNFEQKVVTSDAVRQFLRKCGSLNMTGSLEKLLLLEYCLEDLLDSEVGKNAYNLPLLPLANGDFGLISEHSKGPHYIICNETECKLLEQISHMVIDPNSPKNISSRLLSIAEFSGANVVVFNVELLVKLLHEFVPSDWRFKSKVLWDQNTLPSSSWFLLFWEYLRCHCKNLSLFDDWPILPSTSGHLHRASKISKLIDTENLPEKMKVILEKIGCKILDKKYKVEHHDLSHYVSNATAAVILEAIFDVVSSSGDIMQTCIPDLEGDERNELRTFLLDSSWYIGGSMVDSDIKRGKKLPIFRVYAEGSANTFQFSDIDETLKYLAPTNVPSLFLGSEFICSASVMEEEILSKYYGVERMKKAHFYRKEVFCRIGEIQPEERDSIMISVLRELSQLCIEDSSFKEALRNIVFVPTSTGVVKCPTALYDPRNEELYALLEDADVFPSGPFKESDILDVLQGLGMKTSVSPETIIQSARTIEQLLPKDPQKAYLRGKVLLAYLEASAHRWASDSFVDEPGALNRILSRAAIAFRPRNCKSDLEKFWSDLRMICWCPVLVSAPHQALPWPVVSSTVAPPKLVRLKTDMWLVSASMRILDGECYSSVLSYHLGWSTALSGSVIAAQILELGKNNEIVVDQAFRQELALTMPRIYARLTELIGSDEMEIVKAVLEGCRWVWVGDGFATADEVVLSGTLHLAPYIRVVPVDLAVFRELFLELEVREFLSFTDYASILCRMSSRKEGHPLTPQELTAAFMIVQHLAESQLNEKQVTIYLPDASCQLLPASELVFNDAPWLLGLDDSSSSNHASPVLSTKRSVQKFVHGNISNDVAERLGVCSLRRLMLAESADSMNLGLSGAVEAFGQHEALTTRLKHILEMYADGPGILFELVQNAEDAGASEVIFLLDTTQYGTSSVLSPEMADWQGPALYCYNDSVFSPHDLYAISRIGQESKLEKALAIGRFGLGFNCVYHFTDIPGFVSGENIVMFDPHACNLPGISASHPGLRIRFVGRRILEQFPDQFSPFLHFGCDLQHPFPGTLFRFPLRNFTVAQRSQIKKEGYAPEDVLSLFSSFSKVVSETLLFLHKVKSISIYAKNGSSSDMQLLHRVERNHIIDPESEAHTKHPMFQFMHSGQANMETSQFLDKLSRSVKTELRWTCQKVVMKEQHMSSRMSHLWLMSECFGTGEVDNPKTPKTRSKTCIPWAAVAAQLRSVEFEEEQGDDPSEGSLSISSDVYQVQELCSQQQNNFEGRAFCFLPLPINTGLPAHVNAYFELSSNRRDIWFGNDMSGGGKKRSDWNVYLLENVAAPAYGRLLEKMALELGPCDILFSFWPTKLGVEPWSSMVRKVYMYIADACVPVLYTKSRGGRWISTKQALFPDFSFAKMVQLIEALSDAGLPVVTVSQTVVERFMDVRPSLYYLTPQLLRSLLIRRKYEFNERSALILTLEYCLFDVRKPVNPEYLHGLPLIPLASGSSTILNPRGVAERIYITHGEEYGLLKNSLPSQLVDNTIPEEVYDKLCDIAQSENSNISFLTCDLLEKLFLRILPVDWQNAKQVTWSPGLDNHPTLEWIKLLWKYLKLKCDDLSVFVKWPILPVGNRYLLQLVRNSNIIEDGAWSENISSLLQKVGCLFMRHDLSIEHPQLRSYVQPPTAAGIMNALLAIAGDGGNIEGLFSDASEVELHELRSFVLQSKWFSEDGMDDIHIDVIKLIPMFESSRSRKLSSLSRGMRWLRPNGLRDDLLDDNFVRTESEKERLILTSYLNVIEPSKGEFYKDFVLNRMSEFLPSQETVLAILHDVKLLMEEDISMKAALSVTPFVLTCSGSWQQPCRLYDPRVPELGLLLHKEVFFPSEKFSAPEILDMLVGLGLKQNLTCTDLLDCAKSVSILHDSGDSAVLVQGRRLIECLDALGPKFSPDKEEASDIIRKAMSCGDDNLTEGEEHNSCMSVQKDDWDLDSFLNILVDDKPEDDFWSELKSISWCPVCADPLIKYFPWMKSDDQVTPPSNVRPKSQMWMVSSSVYILDTESYSKYIHRKLGWLDTPNPNVLSTQLIELTNWYTLHRSFSDAETIVDAELQSGFTSLYSAMQEYVNTDGLMVLKSALQGIPWIWIGDGFVSSDALAFDSPVKFHPYLYVVPSELSSFKDLLLALGVKLSFGATDYFHVLQRLKNDVNGSPLSSDQLSFAHCVLEAIAECYIDISPTDISNYPLLIPDSSSVLRYSRNLVYNDAPWMEDKISIGRDFVHPSISNELATRLGVQSLRCMSLVDEEMTKDLPCMDYGRINELLIHYMSSDFLLFDLLELADCCGTKKLHIIFDNRHHPQQSLLQHNLGEFQGPSLIAIFEDANLSREEISSLQLLPPWRLRGETINYGLGLLSCYILCDLLSVLSGGYYYIFDPRGLVLSSSSSRSPAAKLFSLTGNNLMERFRDQFNPMFVGQDTRYGLSNSTVVRMPLSLENMKEGPEAGLNRIKQLYGRFMEHGSRVLLFLKSVLQVSLSTWEEGNAQATLDYSVCVDSSSAFVRNPFSEKKWKKSQISRLFSSISAATKIQAPDQQKEMHVISISWCQGEKLVADKWLTVLSLGSGQTRNMALDRRYLAYSLTPVAGVAALISENVRPTDTCLRGSIMSPLPLSANIDLPVALMGCFLVRHNNGRYLFKIQDGIEAPLDAGNQLIEAWNKELMSCVHDSYIELVLQIMKKRKGHGGYLDGHFASPAVDLALKTFSDKIYSLWPRSMWKQISNQSVDSTLSSPQLPKADWGCVIERVIRPFYARLSEIPVWQLYSGDLVRVEEGMFLSQPGSTVGDSLLPATVCNFVKEHYPVFSVPWDLITEIQSVGVRVREIKPKMVRELLKVSSTSIVVRSVEDYVDVLEYCLSDIQIPDLSDSTVTGDFVQTDSSASISSIQGLHGIPTHGPVSSGGDALVMMTSFGRALIDFGRGVVEDMGRAGGPSSVQRSAISSGYIRTGNQLLSIIADLRGLPCPTARDDLATLGISDIWVGNKEQQILLTPLLGRFIHLKVLDRSVLAEILLNSTLQPLLKIQRYSLHFLADNIRLLFHESWVNHVMNSSMSPWFSWENNSSTGGEGGPSPEWIRLFWRNFDGSVDDLSVFADWPLIPAFLGRPVLCRVRERRLVFIPPILPSASESGEPDVGASKDVLMGRSVDLVSLPETMKPYLLALRSAQSRYPWLLSLLNQCNIPIYDPSFLESAVACNCLPASGQSLGQVIASKLVAAKQAGYFPELTSFLASDRDELFNLFVSDFSSNSSSYGREELDVLGALPIYRTVVGSYTRIDGQDLCIVSPSLVLKPDHEQCLSYAPDSSEGKLLKALGVQELNGHQILVRFALPAYEHKSDFDRRDILLYTYRNWHELQTNPAAVQALKETNFVRNADEFSMELSKPPDLFDPSDSLLISVFSGERKRFPGEQFAAEDWLRILRKLGLRTSAEPDVILECAKRVEFLGSEFMKQSGNVDNFDAGSISSSDELSLEVWTLGESVLQAIFSNFAVLYSNNFCSSLGQIACVPTERGFPYAGGKRGKKRVLSSYSEAILFKDWPLAWSYAPIISKTNLIPPEYSWGALHLRSPPTFATVLKHFQLVGRDSGGDTLAHWPAAENVMSVEDASCEVLKYLEKVWDSLSSSDVGELKNVAFLPAANGTRLVRANCLFVRLGVNLSPFAFELPTLYLPFVRILKDLGLREHISVSSAKEMLLHLQKLCGYQRLNPNEFRAVTEILHFICDGTDDTNKSDRLVWESEAVVPDDACRLVHARSCVYLDSYGSRFVKYIDSSRLRFAHPDISERICLALGLRKLCDVVVEELDDKEPLQKVDRIGPVSLALIKRKLSNRSFQEAICRIVSSLGNYVCRLESVPSELIRSLLVDVAEKLQFVQCIYTRFLLLPQSMDITYISKESAIPEWGDGSRHRTLYYINHSVTCILVAEPLSYIPLSDLLAFVVSDVLGSPTPLPIGPLFLCPEGSECLVIDTLMLVSGKGVSSTTVSSGDSVGKEIAAQDALQVQLHPLRPFYMGEIVAWRSQAGEKLKYGRIPADVRPSAGQALYRFKVETAPGVTESLLSSQVFSFKSVSVDSEASTATIPEDSHVGFENEKNILPESSSRGQGTAPQSQTSNDLQHGRVSPAELVQAVQEMLSAAGINVDTEKQALLQKTVKLQDEVDEYRASLLLEQGRAESAVKEAETAKTSWQCRICLAAEVDITLVPCGHVLCRRCSSAVSRCPFCRYQVSKAMRIYRP